MTPDIRPLLDKAEQSLAAAALLRDQGYFDFSVSRAYYSMFYVAEALLASIGLSYSSHGAVLGAFGREFAKAGKLDIRFHRRLIDAQDYRNTGDYGIDVALTPEQAQKLCGWARQFLDAAESHLAKAE